MFRHAIKHVPHQSFADACEPDPGEHHGNLKKINARASVPTCTRCCGALRKPSDRLVAKATSVPHFPDTARVSPRFCISLFCAGSTLEEVC